MTDLETALRSPCVEEEWLQPIAVQDSFSDLTLTEDKGAVMRALSSSFKKSEMKKVYSPVVRYGDRA